MSSCGKQRANFSVEHLLASPEAVPVSVSVCDLESAVNTEWAGISCHAGPNPMPLPGLRITPRYQHDVPPAQAPLQYTFSPPSPSPSAATAAAAASTVAQLHACLSQWPALLDAYRALALIDSAHALDVYRALLDGGKQQALGVGLALGMYPCANTLQSLVAPPTPVSVSAPALSPSLGLPALALPVSIAPASSPLDNLHLSAHHRQKPGQSSSQPTSTQLQPPLPPPHAHAQLQLSPMSASSQAPSSGVGVGAAAAQAQKVVSCAECGKVFNAQYNLARHMVIHSGARPFVCKVRYTPGARVQMR